VGQLGTQKRTIALGVAIGAVLTLAVVGALVLLGARDSKTERPARPAAQSRTIYTLRWGDVVRDPRTGTRCEATGEGGIPELYCRHRAKSRYAVVFWNDELQVYGPGSQVMLPSHSFKWWGR
jgi:hypothetical protein